MTSLAQIAVTGATGFVGRSLTACLSQEGPGRVRALVRPGKQARPGLPATVEPVGGDLGSDASLARLVKGADVVVHLAGLTKARQASEFSQANAISTGRLVELARRAGVVHFIHVSSLAAGRPDVSAYARSKADSETLARAQAGQMAVSIIRAPAVLGPGDDATAPLLQLLARGFMPVPGGAAAGSRFSIIDVEDLALFLARLALAQLPAPGLCAPFGHQHVSWEDIARAAGNVLGRPVRTVRINPGLLHAGGIAADLAARLGMKPHVFSSGKVRELLSGDWIGDHELVSPRPLETTLERCLAPLKLSARDTNRHPAGGD